jgi:trigger factor
MQITETSVEGLKREYQVTIGAADIDKRMQRRLTQLAKDMRLPGFRPGKVPVSVVRQRFGQSILGEVLEETVNDSSSETLKERNIRPALQPKIEITSFGDGQDLVYAMKVELLPDVEVPDLASITLERLQPDLADEEVDDALKTLAERFRKAEPVEEGVAAETGDVLTIDFTGRIEGEEFPGGKAEGQVIEIGAGKFIPGFEDQLLGAKAGDAVTVNVTFPAEYSAEHVAGKDAVFDVTVTEVKRKAPAVIDDSLAENLGMGDLAELRTVIRERMLADYARAGRQRLKRDLLDLLAQRHSFDVPPGMVEFEFGAIWKQYEEERERAKEAGTYQPEEGDDEEKAKAEYRAIAERRVRLGLLLAEIGKTANILVTQDELNRAITAEARQYRGQEKVVLDYYKKHPEAVQALQAPIYEDKVVDYIVEHASVTDKPLPIKEFLAAAAMEDMVEATEEAAQPA